MTIDDLQHRTNLKDDRSHYKRPSPPEAGRNWPDKETAKESAGLQDAHGVGIDTRLLLFTIVEIILKRFQGEDSAYYAGVVGEEE